MLIFIGFCYCFNATSSHAPAALRNGNFRIKVYRTCETFIMECAGVVVGEWVEWWSGIGWSGLVMLWVWVGGMWWVSSNTWGGGVGGGWTHQS